MRLLISVVGYGGISLAVEGPSKVDIQTEDLEDGTCKVSYFPTVPGVYIVSTKFADEHIPGKWERLAPLFNTAEVLPSCPGLGLQVGWLIWCRP